MNDELGRNGSSTRGSAFVWTLKFLIKVAIGAIFALVLISSLWLGWLQIDRWLDRTTRRLVLLETDAANLLEVQITSDARNNDLRTQIAVEEQKAATTSAELSAQSNAIATLESQIISLVNAGRSISETGTTLGEGMISLQTDVIENIAEIDDLGGQLDSLSTTIASLEVQITDLEGRVSESDDEVIRLQQALFWFRLWELIARARQQITDSNFDLASNGIKTAIALASSEAAESNDVNSEIMASIIDRLELASRQLPEEPGIAARDLESTWEIVDQVIAVILGNETGDLGDVNLEFELSEPVEGVVEATPTSRSEPATATAALDTATPAVSTPEFSTPES